MKTLQNIKEYYIPVISIVLAIGSFFTGRWYENETLKLEREKLLTEQVTFQQELERLKSEHQKDLQFKYIELLSENFNEETFYKAEIIIHLIEDPQVRIKFSNYTQKLIKKKDNGMKDETANNLKGSFANTSYQARKEIEKESDKRSNFIIQKAEQKESQMSKSDSITLVKLDEAEQEKNESKFNTYKSFIKLLSDIKTQSSFNEEQMNEYLEFHVLILNMYADDNLKTLMDNLFEARNDGIVGQKTNYLIDEIIATLNNELSQTLWCKAGYFINWNDVMCSVTNVSPSEGTVTLNLIDSKSKEIIVEDLTIKEKETKKIDVLNFSIHLTKIDNAGKNVFKKAAFFKFTALG